MFNSFKTTLRKWAALPFQDVTNLVTWADGKSDVEFGNRNLLVAKATDVKGKAVGYLTAEPVLIISDYAVDPRTTLSDVQQIGDSIDGALAEKAKEIGADHFMIVVPDGAPHLPGERLVRVFYREIPHKTTIGNTTEKRFSGDPRTNSVKFIN